MTDTYSFVCTHFLLFLLLHVRQQVKVQSSWQVWAHVSGCSIASRDILLEQEEESKHWEGRRRICRRLFSTSQRLGNIRWRETNHLPSRLSFTAAPATSLKWCISSDSNSNSSSGKTDLFTYYLSRILHCHGMVAVLTNMEIKYFCKGYTLEL